MANTDKPYRRVGTNSWEELLDQVNDVLQNPPDSSDCEAIDTIDVPDAPHKWSKADIQEVHDKLNEMPGDCFDFAEIPDKWKLTTITDIEDQLDEAWCECEEDCICSNAQAESVITYLGSWDITQCLNCFIDPTRCDANTDAILDMKQAGGRAELATNNWGASQGEYCKLQKEVEELENELENLEETRDEECAKPDNAIACQEAQEAVDEKQAELDAKIIERDAKKAEADAYSAEADAEADACTTFGILACDVEICGTCLVQSAGLEPIADTDCDSINCGVGEEETPRGDRCRVSFQFERQLTISDAGWSVTYPWTRFIFGGYTPNGLSYITGVAFFDTPPCVPAYGCQDHGSNQCEFRCVTETHIYEARLVQFFPSI